ncbi:hypothetical protein HanIR_Chr08g0352131 [Helianthus annuus]|nr:hypothetical protein HanIR_Chr08g0352131 [Helianthus annuus]
MIHSINSNKHLTKTTKLYEKPISTKNLQSKTSNIKNMVKSPESYKDLLHVGSVQLWWVWEK